MGTMGSSRLEVTRGNAPVETRPFARHGHAEVHHLGGGMVMRGVFEPGWKWSKDVAPIAGTKSCQAPHLIYVISGRMRIRMDDGAEDEVRGRETEGHERQACAGLHGRFLPASSNVSRTSPDS